jgi:uncharacterized protein YqfA (UPF0365 family)
VKIQEEEFAMRTIFWLVIIIAVLAILTLIPVVVGIWVRALS